MITVEKEISARQRYCGLESSVLIKNIGVYFLYIFTFSLCCFLLALIKKPAYKNRM